MLSIKLMTKSCQGKSAKLFSAGMHQDKNCYCSKIERLNVGYVLFSSYCRNVDDSNDANYSG